MLGLKLHPLAGFYPNDRKCYPFYELCVQYDVPILFHVGLDPAAMRSKYGDPICLNDVCIDFPTMRVMGAHMGGNFHVYRDLLVELMAMHPNLYADLSYDFGFYNRVGPLDYYRRLRSDLDRVGPRKIAWGSDYPYVARDADGMTSFLDVYRQVPKEAHDAGVGLSDDEVEDILHGTAEEWLGRALTDG